MAKDPGDITIQFTKHSLPYNAGEKADFPPEEARKYIKAGCAVQVADDAPLKTEVPQPKPEKEEGKKK